MIDVGNLEVAIGSTVELDRVLVLGDDEKVTIGTPVIDGAKVLATPEKHGKGKKVIVFKYKPKVRYHVKKGHRQLFTRLTIDKIVSPGEAETPPPTPAKRTRRPKKEVTTDGS